MRMVKANVRMRVYACAKLKGKSNSLSYLDYGSPTKVSPWFLWPRGLSKAHLSLDFQASMKREKQDDI